MTHQMQRAKYVQRVAQCLGMRDWEIRLLPDAPGDPNTNAACYVPHGRRVAAMKFNPELWGHSKQDIRGTVVHELLHAQAWPLRTVVRTCRDYLATDAWNIFWENFEYAEERFVDDLSATVVMEAIPLPPFGVE